MKEGNPSNIISYVWTTEYDDMLNRFEASIKDIDKIKTVEDLYEEIGNWQKYRPTQKQMDLYSEYYGMNYYDVKEYAERKEKITPIKEPYFYEFKANHFYNSSSHQFRKWDKKNEVYLIYLKTEERIYNFKYGSRIVIRDAKTKQILAHFFDYNKNQHLGVKKIEYHE